MNKGLSVLQRLQKEGLFNFKNVPKKKDEKVVKHQSAKDAAYTDLGQLKSFTDTVGSPDINPKKRS